MATRKKIPLIPTDAALTITAAKTVSHAFDFIHSGADLSLVGSGTEQFEFPTSADTLVGRASADTITGVKTFGTIGGAVGKLALAGATSGFSLLNAAAVAGATTLTLPATTGTLALTSDIPTLPVKAIGSELDTGSDDAKFATSKAIKDSHNIPSVVPSTDGNVLTSNGTDWVSEAAGGGGASQLSELSDVVSATNTDKFALMANGTTGYVGRALVEADISDLGSYITISSSDTLTNKTIDGDVNTLSDIAVSSLKEGTDGQLITWGTNAEPTTVATGNNDQVLTSNGAGTAPTFQDAAGGGEWEYVSNLTWSDSETTQSFTSLTGGTYDYKIEWQGYGSDPSDTSGFIYFYLNNDDASGNYNYISHSVSDISYNQSQDKVILGKTKGNVVTYNLIQGQIIFQGNRVNSDYIGYYSLGGGSMDNRYGLINGIYTANADLASIYISPFSGKFTGKVKLYRKANSF